MIVDDSDQLRRLVTSRLERSGLFDVVGEGRDGTEAIGLAYQHQPDLVLLDTSMPAMDGLEALPGILEVSPGSRVVMYTGFEEPSLAEVARELGAADFIAKSHPIERIPERLAEVVGVPARPRTPPLAAVTPRTERNEQDQQILADHLGRFRDIFDVAAIGMATLTLNGTVVRANRALASLFLAQPHELVGVDYGRLTSGRGAQFDEALESIKRGEDSFAFEHQVAGYSTPQIARATLAPVHDSEGVPLFAFLQVQDITAQRAAEDRFRRSEERFRLLVSAVQEYAIFMLDTEGRVISWNAGAQRIKGYRAEEIVGKHFRVFYPEQQQRIRHPEDELRIALQRGSYAEEGWRIRKDGGRFWASVVITAVFDDAGKHVGFAKVTRDQTERRLAEEGRERVLEQQLRLLAVTGHELGTPTAVIDATVESVLGDDQLSEKERTRLLTEVRTSTRRLQNLSSDLLTASRIDAGSLTLRPSPTTLASVLHGAADRARIAAPAADVRVSGDLDADLTVDPVRIGQAVDNLIGNALRHGRPPVLVEGRIAPADPDRVIIKVSDSGPGVDQEIRDRLFDRFVAGTRAGGAGLGLYVVQEVSRLHGGEARYEPPAEEHPGGFVLEIPRHAQSESS
ncbi:PAS domain S-box protein [Microlunatus sp. Gsoil 973]|uniref:hybrid sensor histidine kinase/response regulator n=1 Tax=Microlunatus sp. Gsoil 973 TaxID=2672569 RepID=UPI001E3DDE7C|nr:PAS domain S-box protein [Microlunatus sp. Gsoil 973]